MKYLHIIFFIFFIISCGKEDKTNVLPGITQNGANTFGCKINGVVFSMSGKSSVNNVGCSEGNSVNDYTSNFKIFSKICGSTSFKGINFSIYYPLTIGTFLLGGNSTATGSCDKYPNVTFNTDSIRTGSIIITRADNIVAGTFSFQATADNGSNEIISITEGRFDIQK